MAQIFLFLIKVKLNKLDNKIAQKPNRMDFKAPRNLTKSKFDNMDLDDLGEEVILIDPPMEPSKNPEALQATS